jgi:hypothetical protein
MKKIKNNGKIKELNINVKKTIKTNKIAEVILCYYPFIFYYWVLNVIWVKNEFNAKNKLL